MLLNVLPEIKLKDGGKSKEEWCAFLGSSSSETRFYGKHFATGIQPERKNFTVCAYQKRPDGKYKGTKISNFCRKCNNLICKNCFENFHTETTWKN